MGYVLRKAFEKPDLTNELLRNMQEAGHVQHHLVISQDQPQERGLQTLVSTNDFGHGLSLI